MEEFFKKHFTVKQIKILSPILIMLLVGSGFVRSYYIAAPQIMIALIFVSGYIMFFKIVKREVFGLILINVFTIIPMIIYGVTSRLWESVLYNSILSLLTFVFAFYWIIIFHSAFSHSWATIHK